MTGSPDLVLTVVRPATLSLEERYLQGWRPGRVNWTAMWSPETAQKGLDAHRARPRDGVAGFIIGQAEDWDVQEEPGQIPSVFHISDDGIRTDKDLVVHRLLTDLDTSDSYFGGLGLKPYGMSFLRGMYADFDRNLPETVLQGWLVVHFTAMWPSKDAEENLKHFQTALDVANIAQPLNGVGETVDCLLDLQPALSAAGLNLDVVEDRYNRLLVLARVPQSRADVQSAERQEPKSGAVTLYSERLGTQQYLRGKRLETSDKVGNLSWDYRALVASSHRLVHAIPGSGDPNGIVSHFVDVYPAFVLAAVQDVTLNKFATRMQSREYLPQAEGDPRLRAKHWETFLQDQTGFYAFRSRFWWVQWARRGVGMHLLPVLQDLWGSRQLADQLGDEYRDYGQAASAELARLLIQQEQEDKVRQQSWSILAKIASIIIGGITLLGVWAGLAALGMAQTPTDSSGFSWSMALLIGTVSTLLLLADLLSRISEVENYEWERSPWWARGLLLLSAGLTLAILFGDPGQSAGYVLLAVSFTLLVVASFLLVRLRARAANGR